MSTVYIELAENFLASELGVGFDSEGLEAISGLTQEQFSLFQGHWVTVDRAQHDLMTKAHPLREDTDDGSSPPKKKTVALQSDDRPTSALFSHPYNGLESVDLALLKRQALMFSRVAVITPNLGYSSAELSQTRRVLVSYLQSLLELKPLVEDQTVELLPACGFYSNEIEGGAGIVRTICEKDEQVKEWISTQRESLSDFAKTARKGDPFFDAGISICSALTYGHAFAATHPFVGGLYKQLLSDAPRVDRSRIAATRYINRIDLPGFDDLTWADIKSVRDNEEALTRWRNDLQVAISSVDPDLPPDKFVEHFDARVQAELTRAASNLERELSSSSAMARFKKGKSSLFLSAVAATARVALGGPLAIGSEVVNVLQKEGTKEVIRLMWERKNTSPLQALRSHYAVFSSRN